MLLGVYWYYGFPEGLYHFDYFAHRPGIGGASGGPAELTATVQAPDPAALLAQVRAVAARYPDGYLDGYVHGPLVQLVLSDWVLTDYTFHVAGELETVLRQQQATPTAELLPAGTPLLRLAELHDPTPPYSYGDGELQAVSSRPGRHRAEVALESIKKCGAVGVNRFFGYLGKPYLSVQTMPQPPATSPPDHLAVGYQLKIHLLGISPQISRRVLVRGDTTLAELHHVFQVVMGWENWHLHSFHLWGKDYGISYAGGTWYADDARRVHLGDFQWRVNDKFTYTYDFGDYWQHQVRVEKVLPTTAVPATPVCLSGRRACPPEEVGGSGGYDQRTLDQFSWRYEALDRLRTGEDIREDDVPTWFWTFQPEHFDKDHVNRKLAKLYQLKGNPDFLLSQGGYDYFFADVKA